jgi:hypothetical protein
MNGVSNRWVGSLMRRGLTGKRAAVMVNAWGLRLHRPGKINV